MTRTSAHLLVGCLCDWDMQIALFGQKLAGKSITISGKILTSDGSWRPAGVVSNDGNVNGVLVELSEERAARLAFLCAGLQLEQSTLSDSEGTKYDTYLPAKPLGDIPWTLSRWQAEWGVLLRMATEELMGSMGDFPLADVAYVMGPILARTTSKLRAMKARSPMNVRTGLTLDNVNTLTRKRPYLNYFMVEEQELTFQRFDGTQSGPVKLAAFVSGDAVTVLPYDPVRDRVLLIEQFRMPPVVRGDPHPWGLEIPAGRIDAGESPEDAARREAVEETGLILQKLEHIISYYPSPGAFAEYLYSYVGLVDLPDGVAGVGGLDSEDEDIRSILVSFDQLMNLLRTGEAENGPLIMSAMWLAANRDRLRATA